MFDVGDLQKLLEIHRDLGLPGMPLLPESIIEGVTMPGGPVKLAVTKWKDSEYAEVFDYLSDGSVNLAVRTWVALDLSGLVELRGETRGFLRDLQSIIFLNAVESLLPELRSCRHGGTP